MKKKLILPLVAMTFGALGTVGCLTSCSDNNDSSSRSEVQLKHLTSMSISNKEALQAAWERGDSDRSILLTTSEVINLSAYIQKGWITITSSNTELVAAIGSRLQVRKNDAGTATITVTYSDGTTTLTDTVTVTVTKATAVSIKSIYDSDAVKNADTSKSVELGTYCVKAVVTAVNSKGYVLDDGTGAILVYNAGLDLSAGTHAIVKGTLTSYKGLLEFTSLKKVEEVSDVKPTLYLDGTAKKSYLAETGDATTFDTDVKSMTFHPIEIWGTAYAYGSYTAFKVNDLGTTVVESMYYPTSGVKKIQIGKAYKLKGYARYGSSYTALYVDSVEDFSLNAKTISIAASGTPYFNAENKVVISTRMQVTSTNPVNATNKEVTWSIAEDDASLATIDEKGVLTPKALGTVTVNAVYKADATIKASTEVEIKDCGGAIGSLTLTPTADVTDAWAGLSQTLTAALTDANAEKPAVLRTVTWTSSDTSIATVKASEDTLTATITSKKAGTVTITATTDNVGSDGKHITASRNYTFKSVTKASQQEDAAKASGNTMSNGNASYNNVVSAKGVVVASWKGSSSASGNNNFMVDDGESGVFWVYYSKTSNVAIGDVVSFSGTLTGYSFAYEIKASSFSKTSGTMTAHTETAVAKEASAITSLPSSSQRPTVTEKWSTTLYGITSGSYTNLYTAQTNGTSIRTNLSSQVTGKIEDGKTYTVEYYPQQYYRSQWIVVTSLTEQVAEVA